MKLLSDLLSIDSGRLTKVCPGSRFGFTPRDLGFARKQVAFWPYE